MALDTQAQGLGALQQQECIERGDGGTGIAQQDGADVGNEGSRACGIGEGNTVVAGVGIGDIAELAAGLPVKLAACLLYTSPAHRPTHRGTAARRTSPCCGPAGNRAHRDTAALSGSSQRADPPAPVSYTHLPAAQIYVVVHEYCHFLQPNHSPAFWAEVEKLLPDWKERRALLK